jgi:hypothetical protein
MLEFVSIVLLIAVSALIGVVITFFTKPELRVYKHKLVLFQLTLLMVAIGVAIPLGFRSAISVIALFIGYFIARYTTRVKYVHKDLASIAIVLASSYSLNVNFGFLFAAFMALHNIAYASIVNIAAALRGDGESKHRVTEQIVFIIAAVITYKIVVQFDPIIQSAILYAGLGALMSILTREIKIKKK